MFGLLDDFEQYPDYAMRTTQSGKRIREPWASGPSPLAQGLMALGSGMVGDGATPWVGGGGAVWDDIGRGMRLGTQAFLQGHQGLQDRRSDYYTHRRAEEDQLIKNQQAYQQLQNRNKKIENFPKIIKALKDYNNTSINSKIPSLYTLAQGDIDTAYNTVYNLLSANDKEKFDPPEVIGGSVLQKEINTGKYHLIHTPSKDNYDLSPNKVLGRVLNSSTKLKEWSDSGSLIKPKDILPSGHYSVLYGQVVKNQERKVKTRDEHGKETVQFITDYLKNAISPVEYGILQGLPTDKIKQLEGDLDRYIDISKYSSEAKKSIAEAKDISKVGLITQVEFSLKGSKWDPTKVSLIQYGQFFSGGQLPFKDDADWAAARTYEQQALIGSRMFGYLFSGATVKDDENRAMRIALYPMPGDLPKDVERKRRFRETVIDLYKTYMSPEISKKIFNRVLDAATNKTAPNPAEIEKIVNEETNEVNNSNNNLTDKQFLDQVFPRFNR
ncbi:MAG: hypothetical protein Unbinned2902contig1001_39 [Prokaryotic dsDNA virus sp.]|nr:MAG: hypothetical protein Unbinned2902contig1001_39 [Prokaryotic dsDNA virus sp.]|tara:strand:- start:28007 stop:29497 length:1491 start_codon:yes stop_codon:yes gene_type:complete